MAGVIKKVHPFENTFNVQLTHSYQGKNDKKEINVLENVNRQDIISSSWARKVEMFPRRSFRVCQGVVQVVQIDLCEPLEMYHLLRR